MNPKNRKIGLALGGGGARGWAHIGVINAPLELGLEIQCVAGTSIGAVVGAAFASGRIGAMHAVAMELDWKRVLHCFLEPSLPRMGLIDGTRIAELSGMILLYFPDETGNRPTGQVMPCRVY